MGALQKIELEVSAEMADALMDERRRQAAVRLLEAALRPGRPDPLAVLFAEIAEHAERIGFTEEDLQAELAAYNAEGRR